jgi:2',3'-cyclic-nucleotide 2'-phosphodiesterase (5'-nucleotidase family)
MRRRARFLTTFFAVAALIATSFAVAGAPAGAAVPGQVVITEWMYNPATAGAEFVELTNVGGAPVNMANYSFDDDSRTAGTFSLSSLGTLAPGESGVMIEGTAAAFRADWGLAPDVKTAEGNTANLGRADEINIFETTPQGTNLVDRLTFGDQTFAGTIRTQGVSGIPTSCLAEGANNVGLWKLSAVGDGLGTTTSANGNVGSPGTSPLNTCGPVTIVGGNGTGNPNTLPCTPEAASGTGPATPGAQPWPGSSSVTVADQTCAWKTTTGPEGRDMSGLVFDPTNPNVLWAVKNKSWVFRLVKQNDVWVADSANGWGAGKQIFFPGGTGQPDSEGLTVGGDGALYVTTERDNTNNQVSLDSILRFDPSAAGTTLTPTTQWDLTADFPELGVAGKSNLGFEGVTYVPDSYLVANGFVDQSTGQAYNPASYANHGFGLYFAALENDGKLYAYALSADGSSHRVATVDTDMGHVMDVQYDRDLQRIWALCDNTCSVSQTLLKIDGTGAMVPDVVYAAPTGLPNVNVEGFAIAPDSTCSAGTKEVVWSDDGISAPGHEGHALYRGTFPCESSSSVDLTFVGTNDFHGRIDANTVSYAGTVEQLRAAAGEDHTVFVGGGDLVGASLFASAVAQDQPTIEVMNALDLDASAVGNHEFDQGYADLTNRIVGNPRNAQWDYLGANVYEADGVTPALPEYSLVRRDGLTVGIIGAVTQETPALVSPAGVAGLVFGDPVDAVNRVAAQLSDGNQANGEADVIVASYHEGAPNGDPATLESQIAASTVFAKIVNQTSPDVDVIFNGHTHKPYAYAGPVPGQPGVTRPIVQAGEYGSLLGEVKLTVDRATGTVTAHTQRTVARTTTPAASLIATYPRVSAVDGIVSAALANANAVGSSVVGTASSDITTAFTGGSYQAGKYVGSGPNPDTGRDDRASESTLGNFVADALLDSLSPAERGGAEIGVVNPGGLRAELFQGDVTYAEANSVLPFVNNLWTTTLTGAQFKTLLEQQWQRDAAGNIPSRPYLQLGLSKNVSYTYDPSRPEGSRITSISMNGAPIDPTHAYRIGTFSFLVQGGDNFRIFTSGTDARDSGLIDRDVWISYIGDHSPVAPSFARRSAVVSGFPAAVAAGAHVTGDVSKLDLTSLGSPQNTSVVVKLDGASIGSATVTGGAAHVDAVIPLATAPGAKTLTLEAAPSGTVVRIPLNVTAAGGALRIATTSLPNGAVGQAYSQTIVAVGGTAPRTFKVSGKLPQGLALDATTGVLSGTPTASGQGSFKVTVTDAAKPKGTARQELTLRIAPSAILVTPGSLPGTVAGATYSVKLGATGATKPYSFKVVGGSLPAGLTLSSNGTLKGKATTVGTASFTVQATDKLGFTGTHAFSITVTAELHVSTTSVPDATIGVPYSASIVAGGGTAPYAFKATGKVPAGLHLNPSTGALTGTPTARGQYTFGVSVSDATKPKATVKVVLTMRVA